MDGSQAVGPLPALSYLVAKPAHSGTDGLLFDAQAAGGQQRGHVRSRSAYRYVLPSRWPMNISIRGGAWCCDAGWCGCW